MVEASTHREGGKLDMIFSNMKIINAHVATGSNNDHHFVITELEANPNTKGIFNRSAVTKIQLRGEKLREAMANELVYATCIKEAKWPWILGSKEVMGEDYLMQDQNTRTVNRTILE